MNVKVSELREVRNRELSGEQMDNSLVLSRNGAEAQGKVDELVALLIQVERAIVLVDRVLRVAQPPISGKLGVRWWKTHGGAKVRTPVLCTWHPVLGGRWRARPVKQLHRNRITRDGSAALCADNVYVLAQATQALIREYRSLRSALDCVLQRLNHATATFQRVRTIEATLMGEHRQVVDKLDGAGYAVEQRIRDLPDRYIE